MIFPRIFPALTGPHHAVCQLRIQTDCGKVNSVDPAARIPNLLDTAYWTEVVRQNWAGGASNQLARVDSRSIFHPCSCQPDTCRSDGDQVCDLACNCEFRKPPTSLHSVYRRVYSNTASTTHQGCLHVIASSSVFTRTVLRRSAGVTSCERLLCISVQKSSMGCR